MSTRDISLNTLIALAAASTISTSPAPDEAPVQRVMTLPVELKDPLVAYGLGLIPFYSTAPANYVGTSRLRWNPSEEIQAAARDHFWFDAGVLGVSIGLGYLASTAATPDQGTIPRISSSLVMLAIPLVHAWAFAPYWGQQAVAFNKGQLEQAGFKDQANWR